MFDEYDINIEKLEKSLKENGTSLEEIIIKNRDNMNLEEFFIIEDEE